MKFQMGCAAPLYAAGAHPRLLCDTKDLADLRRRVRSGWGKKIFKAVERAARKTAVEKGPNPLAQPRQYIANIALVAAINEDARLIDVVRRQLLALPAIDKALTSDRLSVAFNSGDLAFAYDLHWHRFTQAEREPIARWLGEAGVKETINVIRTGNYLRHAGMNIPMMGMLNAVKTALAIDGDPGAPDLTAEKQTLVQYMEACLFSALGPEGYPVEDIGYGTAMTGIVCWSVEALRRAGLYDAYTQCPRYARMGRAILHFLQPWGEVISNTGDYGADFGVRSLYLPRVASETKDPAVLYLHGTVTVPYAASGPYELIKYRKEYPEVTLAPGFHVPADAGSLLALDDLKKPVHPSRTKIPTAFMDRDRGIVSFRSSWKPDATFVFFDGSQRPAGAQGHAHDSGAHFSLSALGEYFAIDTGRYNIEQQHHNVVIVNGKSGHVGDGSWKATRYQAQLTGYHPGDFVDTASVNYSQMANCYWARRTLGLVKGDEAPGYVWTAEDVNFADDFREFHWLLNAHPDSTIEFQKNYATINGAYQGNKLDVHFALPDPSVFPKPHTLTLTQDIAYSGSPKEYLGAESYEEIDARYRKNVGAPEWGPVYRRPRLVAKVAGYNGRFVSLMIPRKRGEKPAAVEQLPTPDNTLALRIVFPKVEDVLVWSFEHHLLDAADIQARGQWCLVRRSRATGKVLRHTISRGVSFKVGGKTLPMLPHERELGA